ncbi:ABC transporter ATP-binding protein [soil metagenome]
MGRSVTGPALSAEGLVKSFGQTAVLAGVDLAVQPGETLAVLGPSGCGKTTLLRILAGFDLPDRGSVHAGGAVVTGPHPSRGMVAQAGTLFPWLTLHDNLAFGPRAAGMPAAEVADLVDDLLDATGLDGFADALPRQLSGGMRQRGAIAQVLATTPPVLLLDEPFGALDAQTRLRMHEWLLELLQRRPTAVVLVTHDVDEALLLGDRLALLSQRPATITRHLDVDAGGGRSRDRLVDPAFVALKAEVLAEVLDQS